MANDLNRSIKIYIDGSDATQGIGKVETSIAKLEAKLAKLSTGEADYEAKSKQLKSELTAKQAVLNNYKKKVEETSRVLNNLSGSSYDQLLAVSKQVRREVQSSIPDTQKHTTALEQNRRVTEALSRAQAAMRVEVGSQGSMWNRSAGFINKYIGMAATAIATVTGLVYSLNRLNENSNKRESSKSEVEALTGLSKEDINWLEQRAVSLATTVSESGIRITNSVDEILEAYKLVGGAKPELLNDKEALVEVTTQTLILAKASGMELKDAVDAVTLSLNQYSAGADQAARYSNVMAAGAKFGAAEVDSVTAAIKQSGVSAASAKIPIEGLVGTIETLAEKGIKDEQAGTGLKRFFLTLQTGADETNPRIVGLEAALNKLQEKQMSATEIKKKFGEEGYNVASVLINEADKVKYYTEAVTGSAAAEEQAIIRSEDNASKLAQAKAKMHEVGILLINELSPSITDVIESTAIWTEKLIPLYTFLSSNWRMLLSVTIAIGSYVIAMKLAAVAQRIHNASVDAGTFSVKNFTKVMKLNPWGLLVSGITAAISYFVIFKKKTEDATDAQKDFNAELDDTKAAMDRIAGIKLKGQNLDTLNNRQKQDLKSEAQTEINVIEDKMSKETAIFRKYYTAQKTIINARNDINQAQKSALLRGLDVEAENKGKDLARLLEQKNELVNLMNKLPDDKKEITSGSGSVDEKEAKKILNKKLEDEKTLYLKHQADLKASYLSGNNDKLNSEKEFEDEMQRLELEHLQRTIRITGAKSQDGMDAQNQMNDIKLQQRKAQIQKSIDDEKILYENQQNDLKQVYSSGNDVNLRTEAAYNDAMEQLTIMHLQRTLEIAGLNADQRRAIEQQLLDFKVKCMQDEEKEQKKLIDAADKKKEDSKKREQQRLQQQAEQYRQYGQQIGDTVGQVISGQEDAMQSFADTMIDILFDILSQMIDIEIAKATGVAVGAVSRSAAESFAQPDSVATFGATGAVRAAVLSGLIMGALATAKSALKGLIHKGSSSSSTSNNAETTKTATVQVSQWASGRYDVVGATDKKHYNDIPYIGPAPTGIVQRTSLISENGSELIINSEDLSRLQQHINYPLVIQAINDARRGHQVQQRAEGNYTQVATAEQVTQPSSSESYSTEIQSLIAELKQLMITLKSLKAYVVLRDIKDAQELNDKSTKPFTRTKI